MLVVWAFVNPGYFDQIPLFSLFFAVVKVITFLWVILRTFSIRKKFSRTVVPLFIYAIIPVISTVLGKGDYRSALLFFLTILSITLVPEMLDGWKLESFCRALARLMNVFCLLNLLSIIFVPGGLYHYSTTTGWESNEVWIFGLRNGHPPYLLFSCFAAVLYWWMTRRKNDFLRVVEIHLVSGITILLLHSGGGLVAFSTYCLLLIVFCLRVMNHVRIRMWLVVVLHILIFFSITFLSVNGAFDPIFDLLGGNKSYTFGVRQFIWENVWMRVASRPILGYGFMRRENLTWLMQIAAGAVTSHNSMLDMLFRGGSVTLISFVVYMFMIAREADNASMDPMNNYCCIAFFCIMLLLQTEGAMTSPTLFLTLGLIWRFRKNVRNYQEQRDREN